MKKHLKWLLIIALAVLVCAGLFVKFVVFPVGNNNSLLWEKLTFSPPGSLPEPWMIAPADRSDIGQTVSLHLPTLLGNTQYDNSDSLGNPNTSEQLLFVYLYDEATGLSRLVVTEELAENPQNCRLTVFEPEWIGGEALCANLEKPFSAKILHRVNISWYERNFLVQMMWGTQKEQPALIIDPAVWQDHAGQGTQRIYGMYFYDDESSDKPMTLWLQQEDPNYARVFQRIADRFDLAQYLK